ncbi:MAG: DUF962 domain-containing protein [Flavobacteriales bacterium]
MNTLQDWFDKYGESHQNPVNKAFHWICVPVIFVSIIGLLSLVRVPLGSLDGGGFAPYLHGGTVLIMVGMVFYLRLSLSMSLGMLAVSAASLYLVKLANLGLPEQAWMVFLGAFVAAWIGQFIGHKIEGAKPSFFDDLKFLMVGPAWLLGFIYRKLGIGY